MEGDDGIFVLERVESGGDDLPVVLPCGKYRAAQ